jgi:hypothetical protein
MQTRVSPNLLARLAFAAALLALHGGAPRAEIPTELGDGRSPAQLARDTFDSEYGRLLVADFGRTLRASADPQCLRERNIDPRSLEQRGRELLVRSGARSLEIHSKLIDPRKYEAAFTARAGKGGSADFARLRNHPEVKKLVAIGEPAKLARLADNITELVDRHARLARVKLTKPISPVAAGDSALMAANPEEKIAAEIDRLLKNSVSPSVERWFQLEDASVEALRNAFDSEGFARLTPRQMTPDAVTDLADLCVGPR